MADADNIFQLRSDQSYSFIGSSGSRAKFELRFPLELERPSRALLAILRADDLAFVGEATFAVSSEGDAEFTVAVAPQMRRNGYGFEAARALFGCATSMSSVSRVVARVHEENRAGLELVRKLGIPPNGVHIDPLGSRWRLFQGGVHRLDA